MTTPPQLSIAISDIQHDADYQTYFGTYKTGTHDSIFESLPEKMKNIIIHYMAQYYSPGSHINYRYNIFPNTSKDQWIIEPIIKSPEESRDLPIGASSAPNGPRGGRKSTKRRISTKRRKSMKKLHRRK